MKNKAIEMAKELANKELEGFQEAVKKARSKKIKWEAEIEKCEECPFTITERTSGAGYALNRLCTCVVLPTPTKNGIKFQEIRGYIESNNEEPRVPDWCPLLVK